MRRGLVNTIVVYKIARISRSLADYVKLVELFDQHKVTLVSVTQSFNTTTSMGRLTLNILLSFAQFERELGGERVRDKIAASRKRGIWMGGMPALGYDVIGRKFLPNPKEATLIQEMFSRFAATPSMSTIVKDLRKCGVTSKAFSIKSSGLPSAFVVIAICMASWWNPTPSLTPSPDITFTSVGGNSPLNRASSAASFDESFLRFTAALTFCSASA